LQWLQDPSKINEDNWSNIRREAAHRHFAKRWSECLKGNINELANGSKNRKLGVLDKGIFECKRCYQSISSSIKNENDDLLANSHNMLNRRQSCLPQ
jgi:hypothetical protein